MAKRKFFQPTQRTKEPRINSQIRVPKVRLVVEGSGIEVLDTRDALKLAEEQGLDLVEVSPDQDPPVCKIIDYGKYKYEQQKKKKDQAKNQHVIHIKEIKLKPKIGDHDYEIKRNQTLAFLDKGDKVKVSLRFRGREITHPELGMALMNRLTEDVKEVGQIETTPRMEGRQIIMVLTPMKKKVHKADEPTRKEDKPENATGETENSPVAPAEEKKVEAD